MTREALEARSCAWTDMHRCGEIPLDGIILTLCLLGALVRPPDAPATLVAVAATFLLALYWVLTLFRRSESTLADTVARAQLGIVLAEIALVVVLPTLVAIGYRHDTAPYRAIHDSPLQIEIASKMLLHGQDYYRATYIHTPLDRWWPAGPPNPALFHTDSLPFQELITIPAMLVAQSTLGWFDERFIYLACLGIVLALALRLGRRASTGLALAAGLGLNPLFVPTFIVGQNDVLVLAEVMGVVTLARARHCRSALLLLGTAVATKETALFLAPFLLLWMAVDGETLGRRGRAAWLARSIAWMALPVAVFVGPFVLWDARAFADSTLGFVEGTVPHPFPIRGIEGYGFASFILFGRFVRSADSYWPFGVVQAAIAGPVAVRLLLRQHRDNTLARAAAGYASTLFLMYYFGRFFHASFIAFTVSLALLAFFLGRDESRGRSWSHVSLDFLLLLIVVPQSLQRPTTPALALIAAVTMGLLVLYALVDVWMDGWNRALHNGIADGRNWRLRVGLTLSLLGVTVIWPEVYAIVKRHGAHAWNYVHDTTMQIEEAIRFLLAGKDFYAQNYAHTPMAHWYSSPAMAAALYHTDRPPFGILISVPFYVLSHATLGWFDERMVYLPCLFICVGVLLRLPAPREIRLSAVAGVLLSPFFVPTLVYGQDDVLVLALLLLSSQALYRERYRQGALLLGLACATKHTALFMVPAFVVFLLARHRRKGGWPTRFHATWRDLWPLVAAPTLICAPFALWNMQAFIDGNVRFLAGTVAHSYPIRGIGTYGFSAVVLLGHLVRSANAYYPFALWQAAAALPLLVLTAFRLWHEPTVRNLFALYAVLLFACYFFSRFFQDSGLAYVAVTLVLAALMPAADEAGGMPYTTTRVVNAGERAAVLTRVPVRSTS